MMSKYSRFKGHQVRLTGGVNEEVVMPGLLVHLCNRSVTVDHEVRADAIEGVPFQQGKACGHKRVYQLMPGTVVYDRQDWEWKLSLSIVVTLPRQKLEAGDTIILRTDHGMRGISTVQVQVLQITDCSHSHSNITAERAGFVPEVIQIKDQFVDVVLSRPEIEDES